MVSGSENHLRQWMPRQVEGSHWGQCCSPWRHWCGHRLHPGKIAVTCWPFSSLSFLLSSRPAYHHWLLSVSNFSHHVSAIFPLNWILFVRLLFPKLPFLLFLCSTHWSSFSNYWFFRSFLSWFFSLDIWIFQGIFWDKIGLKSPVCLCFFADSALTFFFLFLFSSSQESFSPVSWLPPSGKDMKLSRKKSPSCQASRKNQKNSN